MATEEEQEICKPFEKSIWIDLYCSSQIWQIRQDLILELKFRLEVFVASLSPFLSILEHDRALILSSHLRSVMSGKNHSKLPRFSLLLIRSLKPINYQSSTWYGKLATNPRLRDGGLQPRYQLEVRPCKTYIMRIVDIRSLL